MPIGSCGLYIPGGKVSRQCDRDKGDTCSDFRCDPGCRPTRWSLRCSYSGEWEDADTACVCDQSNWDSSTSGPTDVNQNEIPLGEGLNHSLVLAVAISVGVAVFLLVTCCIGYLLYRRQQESARRRNQTAAGDLPVIYHEVATAQPPLADSGKRYNNPTYSTSTAVNEQRQSLITGTDTRPTPSAPQLQSYSDTLCDQDVSKDSEQPPSYGEVAHHPEKFKKNR